MTLKSKRTAPTQPKVPPLIAKPRTQTVLRWIRQHRLALVAYVSLVLGAFLESYCGKAEQPLPSVLCKLVTFWRDVLRLPFGG